MTPDEARDLLDGTTPGPWEVDHDHAWEPGVWSPDSIIFGPYYDRQDMEQWEAGTPEDLRLAAAAPDLAALAAGMREEWGVTYTGINHGGRHIDWDPETREEAENTARRYRRREGMGPVTIVRRYVTEPEDANAVD